MAAVEPVLYARARRAYETGRVLLGLRRAALVVPLASISWLCCGRPAATALDAVMLALVMGTCAWRGQDPGRGARLGFWAGLPALSAPVLVQLAGHACGRSFCGLFPAVCLMGGLGAGLVLVWRARRLGLASAGIASAVLVAALAGTLGCLVGGAGGLVGLALGLTVGTAPILAWRRA